MATLLNTLFYSVLAIIAGWGLSLEYALWRFRRRQRRGHQAEEAAVRRALRTLNGR